MKIKVGTIVYGQHRIPEGEKGLGEPYTQSGKPKALGLSTIKACGWCSALFTCKTTNQKTCSPYCHNAAKDEKKKVPCVVCGKRRHPTRKPDGSIVAPTCHNCVRAMTDHGTLRKYQQGCKCGECRAANVRSSLKWNVKFKNENGKSYSTVWAARYQEQFGIRPATAKARAFKAEHGFSYYRSGPSGPSIPIKATERKAIYERDDWVCQLCFEPVDAFTEVHRERASLDHIVPQSYYRSLGQEPDHSSEAMRLTHIKCNSRRGDAKGEAIEELLRLVKARKAEAA